MAVRASALAAVLLAAGPAAAPAAADPLISARIKPDERGRAIPRSFLGFSTEWSSTWKLTGNPGTGVNPVYLGLLRNLAAHGGGVPTLRIGGNYQDGAWWNPDGAPLPYQRGIFVNIKPDLLDGIAQSSRSSGQRLTLGVNLGANDPALARAEAQAFREHIPRRYIRGLEIGNEPDFYVNRIAYEQRDEHGNVTGRRYTRRRGYDGRSYLREWSRTARAVRQGFPRAPLVGTAGYGVIVSPERFIRRERRRLAFYTEHAYPLAGCSPRGRVYERGDPQYPTLAKLLGREGTFTTVGQVKRGVAAADRFHKRYVLDETNSVSCATRQELSSSFATTLWGLDQLFLQLSLGVDGVNFHVGGGLKSPFRFGLLGPQKWVGTADPLYYAMLAFARAAGRHGRWLWYPTLTARTRANARVWAVREGRRLRIVVLNKDLRRGGRVRITVPGRRRSGRLARLDAPSVTSRSVRFAGQSVGELSYDGALEGERREARVRPRHGVYTFTLPRASAALLTIG